MRTRDQVRAAPRAAAHASTALVLALVMAVAVMWAPASASAAEGTEVEESVPVVEGDDVIAEECIDDLAMEVDEPMPTCLTEEVEYYIDGISPEQRPRSGALGGLIIVLVLWSILPFLIAMGLADDRGESMGGAVLLTLVLGWVGLAIVWYGQQKTVGAVRGVASSVAAPAPVAAAPPGDPEERLRRLERLKGEGLLRDDEYEQQRRRIVESI